MPVSICKLSIGTTAGPWCNMFLYMKNKNVMKQTFPQHTRIDSEENVVSTPMINGCNTVHPTPFPFWISDWWQLITINLSFTPIWGMFRLTIMRKEESQQQEPLRMGKSRRWPALLFMVKPFWWKDNKWQEEKGEKVCIYCCALFL